MHKRYHAAFLISSVIFFIAFMLFYYTDLKSLTVWTLNVWDCLAASGNIRTFYEYSAMNLYRLDHTMVGSDILIYLPWAVWNLPLWILQHFFKIHAIEHFWMMLYSKLFLVVMFTVVLYLAKKIAALFTAEKEDLTRMLLLSATSFFTVTSLAYTGQNDVVVIVPFLAAIYQLLCGKRRGVVFWAAVSIAFKPFFIFSYAVMILYLEKELLKDIAYIAGGCSLFILQKFCFLGAPKYGESLSYGPYKGAFGLMLQARLDIPPDGASLFLLGLGILMLLAYFHRGDISRKEDILYYATAPMMIFFLFTRYEAYRPFYLVPLMYLLMLTKPAYNRTNLLLEMAATGSLMCFYLVDDFLFYNPNYLLRYHQDTPVPAISSWLEGKMPGFGFPAFTAVFVLAMVMALIINHPAFHSENEILKKKEEPWLLPIRSLLYGVPLMASILLRIVY